MSCNNCTCKTEDTFVPSKPYLPSTAEDLLAVAGDIMAKRGENYDDGSERSMKKIVGAFNQITGQELSERDGWLFMQVLKLVRLSTAKGQHRDSYEDNIAYAALMAEAALTEED